MQAMLLLSIKYFQRKKCKGALEASLGQLPHGGEKQRVDSSSDS